MIYQIETIQIPVALQNQSRLIIISADSTRALIQDGDISGLNIIEQYEDSELSTLMSDPFWRQPCTNC